MTTPTCGQRWKKLVVRGQLWAEPDGVFFAANEMTTLGVLTESAAFRALDYSVGVKLPRLGYRVVCRGPVKDVVVPLSEWVDWLVRQNPDMSVNEAEEMAYRMVVRTYNRRKHQRQYPTAPLFAWLKARKQAVVHEH